MVEGTFAAPYGIVALAAYEALSQFDRENNSISLHTVNYVNDIDVVTSTFLSTFRDELKRQHNTELHDSSSSDQGQQLGTELDKPASDDGQIEAAPAVTEMSDTSMEGELVHVRMMVCYCSCKCRSMFSLCFLFLLAIYRLYTAVHNWIHFKSR